jgi:hypothetical protein
VRARRAAAVGGEEAVGAGHAGGGEEGVVGGVAGGLDAVARHARAVCERGGAGRGGVLVRGAGGARAVAAGGRVEGVRARATWIGKLLWRVRGPGSSAAARGAETVVDVCGAGQRELAGRAGLRDDGTRGTVVVGGALDAGLRRLVGEAARAEGAGGAGQAQALCERLEAGAADAVLDGAPAGLAEGARVRRAGPAHQGGGGVLEGVGGTLGAEARAVVAAELAGGAGAAHVGRVAIVAEAADAVAAVDAPRERGVEAVEHQQLVRGAAVGGEVADAAREVPLDEVVAPRAEHAGGVGEGRLHPVGRAGAAAERGAVLVPREALAVGEVVHEEEARADGERVLAAEDGAREAVRVVVGPGVRCAKVVQELGAVVAARRPAVRAELVVLVLLEGAGHARVAGEEFAARAARLVPALAHAVEHRVGGLEDRRAAVEHGARGVGGEQGGEASVAAEVAERGVGVGVVAPHCARRADLVAEPVLVVPCAAGGARRLGGVRRQLRRARPRPAAHAQALAAGGGGERRVPLEERTRLAGQGGRRRLVAAFGAGLAALRVAWRGGRGLVVPGLAGDAREVPFFIG